ncbi:MAG: DUF3089 domain-containing protein [Sphingorhabdus sp.]
MARKFLYIVAALITLVIAGGFVFNIYQEELTDFAIGQLEPTVEFKKQEALATNIYDDPKMWFARGEQKANNPTLWQPVGAPATEVPGSAAIFFIHPTSFMARTHWNAPLDDQESQDRARLFLRGLASPFAAAGEVWAPRYRQAGIGAFLTTKPEGAAALDDAYQDVQLAFDHFVKNVQKDRPIILAGHSQGALHLTHLLKDRIAGKPIAKRIVAAYVVGWPVSVTTDLPEMGLPACTSPDQTGCIMAWNSYAEPAGYERIIELYDATTGFNGESRKDTSILCTNPLNGGAVPKAEASANLGTLKPSGDLSSGELVPTTVPARCDDKGFLLIGDPVDMGPYTLPGNNYHVYDYPLFWANIRADALWRTQRFLAR